MKQHVLFLMIALTFASFAAQVQAQTIRFVTPSGAGAWTGAGWANASNNLQDMINKSSAGDEIRVAAGWYSPRFFAYRIDEHINIVAQAVAFF